MAAEEVCRLRIYEGSRSDNDTIMERCGAGTRLTLVPLNDLSVARFVPIVAIRG
jgi:hypothetical protein